MMNARMYVCVYTMRRWRSPAAALFPLEKVRWIRCFPKQKNNPESSWLITGEKGQILFANEKGKEQAKQMLEIQDLGSSEEKIGNQMTLFYGGKTGFGIELRMALPKNLIYASIRSTRTAFLQ